MAAKMLNVNDSSFNVSAPTSPTRHSLENMCFYSVPTTPDATKSKSFKTTCQGSNTNTSFIEFEFETSRRFNFGVDDETRCSNFESPCSQQQRLQRKESLPAMAFADELFSHGKVMPLKPPPRLQYNNESSSGLSSPRSQTGVLKLPFTRRSLWNDDFDPFTVALENVKEENREKIHRRSRSMSPLRARSLQTEMDKPVGFIKEQEAGRNQDQNGLIEANANGSPAYPIRMAEPKGVLFARHARLVKMDSEKPSKPNIIESAKEREDSCTRGTKRQKIKKFLLKSATMGKTSNENKPKDESEALPKRSFTRKFSFKSTGLAQYTEEKRVSEVTKITAMHYRPKLFLCMGYGGRYVK